MDCGIVTPLGVTGVAIENGDLLVFIVDLPIENGDLLVFMVDLPIENGDLSLIYPLKMVIDC